MRSPEPGRGTVHRLPRPLIWVVSVLTVAAVIDDLRRLVNDVLIGHGDLATLIRFAVIAALAGTGLCLALRPAWAPLPFLSLVALMFAVPERDTLQLACFLFLALAASLLDWIRLLVMLLPYVTALLIWIGQETGPPPLFQIAHVTTLITVVLLGRLLRAVVDRGAREKRENAEQVEQAVAREEAIEHRSRQLAERHAEQRRTLSHELHDVVAHELTRITMQATVQARRATDGETRDAFAELADTGRRGLAEMRRLMAMISDDPSAPQPPAGVPASGTSSTVAAALASSAEYLSGVGMRATTRLAGDEATLTHSARNTAAVVLREASTNIAKHCSPGTRCRLSVRITGDRLEITAGNDLATTGDEMPESGFGLSALRTRVEALGGTLRAGPERAGPDGPDEWILRARIPVGQD